MNPVRHPLAIQARPVFHSSPEQHRRKASGGPQLAALPAGPIGANLHRVDLIHASVLGQGNLVLRWSTAEDRAGCIMVSCLALQEQEGKESEKAVRFLEPYTNDAYHAGSSTNWAICVDTSPPEPSEIPTPTGGGSDSYVDNMRMAADSAPERVVALVYLLPGEFAFEGDTVRVPVGKAQVVACKAAYRGRRLGGENIMDALFGMVNARAHATGCALMVTSGIPGYYRTQGYEYGLNMGRGLSTHLSGLSPPPTDAPPSPYTLRRATLDDLPALERLVHAPRSKAEIFIGTQSKDAASLIAQLRYVLGDRLPAYAPPAFPVDPYFILEKRDTDTPDAPPGIVAGRRVAENASAVVQALVRPLASAIGVLPTADGSPNKLVSLRWFLPDAHPLHQWLLAHELAVPPVGSSQYEFYSAWWTAIPSLVRFLEALTPVLNARLAASAHLFGANYTTELQIMAPPRDGRGRRPTHRKRHGVCQACDYEAEYPAEPQPPARRAGAACDGPATVPLVDILFPKRSVWSGWYL
ncbi:hypothetical protein MVEN_01844500 [Mycena venus]|uniref:Uncharacterized protein n=1 Tax=Mycena venus TaxID=2733690 RepID=A0A8H6XGK7_9AGAR|nr:hypothetical protein MVEN_01844500 [Mycena venus]